MKLELTLKEKLIAAVLLLVGAVLGHIAPVVLSTSAIVVMIALAVVFERENTSNAIKDLCLMGAVSCAFLLGGCLVGLSLRISLGE